MKTFSQFVEDAVPTNVTGPAIAKPDVPQFKVSRWSKYPEITVSHDQYTRIRNGRDRYQKWDGMVDHPELKKAIQSALYNDGHALVTSDQSGASVILRHKRVQRLKADQDFTLSDAAIQDVVGFDVLKEQDELVSQFDLSGLDLDDDDSNDEGSDAAMEDEIYDPAYAFAEDAGMSEDDADLFAQVVLAFFYALAACDDDVVNVEATLNCAVEAVNAGSLAAGENTTTPGLVSAVASYINDSYDFSTAA